MVLLGVVTTDVLEIGYKFCQRKRHRFLMSVGISAVSERRLSAAGGVARLPSAPTLELLGQQHPHSRRATPAVTAAVLSAANCLPTTVSLSL